MNLSTHQLETLFRTQLIRHKELYLQCSTEGEERSLGYKSLEPKLEQILSAVNITTGYKHVIRMGCRKFIKKLHNISVKSDLCVLDKGQNNILLAIESKTYLDLPMLVRANADAEKLKLVYPKMLYSVVAITKSVARNEIDSYLKLGHIDNITFLTQNNRYNWYRDLDMNNLEDFNKLLHNIF